MRTINQITHFFTVAAGIAGLMLASSVSADNHDGVDQYEAQALQETQLMLTNADVRAAEIAKRPAAKAADDELTELAKTDANKEAIYDLAADIFEDVTHSADGDPEAMNKMMADALASPEEFADGLSADQKAQLRAIADSIEAAQ